MTTIALTPGCPAGIGPELFPQALAKAQLPQNTHFIWCGSPALFMKHASEARQNGQNISWAGLNIECALQDEEDVALKVQPGQPDENALIAQRKGLDIAIALAKQKQIQGIVTGPIRKAALSNVEGVSYDGQTEYLHHFLAADDRPPLMCFVGGDFILGLATIHVALKDVASRITPTLLNSALRRLNDAALTIYRLEGRAQIVVLGLNPHAGENGLIGHEEKTLITPALDELRSEGFKIEGPVAADGFFGQIAAGGGSRPHAVLAMYHDQGLGPYKLLSKGVGVNMTMGLKIVRTSPAHGTADALAGTGKASAASTTKAIEVCAQCE